MVKRLKTLTPLEKNEERQQKGKWQKKYKWPNMYVDSCSILREIEIKT